MRAVPQWVTPNRTTGSAKRTVDWMIRVVMVISVLASSLAVVTATAPPSAAAQPAFQCSGPIYSIDQSTRAISKIDLATGTVTPNGQFKTQPDGGVVNGLALQPGGGQYIWGLDRTNSNVVRYDAVSETTTTFPTKSLAAGAAVVAGGINPVTGIYYYAVGGTTWKLYAFDIASGTDIGQVATIGKLGTNGDLAFDSLGNMYVVSNNTPSAAGTLMRVDAPLPTTAGTTALTANLVSDKMPANRGQYTSVALGADGRLIIGSSVPQNAGGGSWILQVDPETGTVLDEKRLSISITDLASCAFPNTLRAQKVLPDNRLKETDQFTLSVSQIDPPSTTFDTTPGTTEGTDGGRQDQPSETAGPASVLDGRTYAVTETAAGTTNLANYTTTWQCVDTKTGTQLSAGSGTQAQVTVPISDSSNVDILCDFTNTPLKPGISLDKEVASVADVNANGITDAGDEITWSFTVKNTGAVDVSSLTINDPMAGSVTCTPTTVPVGGSATCTPDQPYTITAADAQNGSVINTATAEGTSPTGDPVESNEDTTTTPIATQAPGITIDKQTTTASYAEVGDVIDYTFVVTNTGNVPLSNVTVNDKKLDAPATCNPTTLAPNASVTCTGQHTVTQADLDAGEVTNVATATGTPPGGDPTTSPEDEVTVPGPAPEPGLTIEKTADVEEVSAVGDVITYTFVVKNTGNVTLSSITINDDKLDAPAQCSALPLEPGQSVECTGTHTVTQADLDAGSIKNVATATGTPPGGDPTTSPEDDVTVPAVPKPALELVKQAQIASYANVGDEVPYVFQVKNTGNVTLTGIAISDDQINADAVCGTTTLKPGEFTECTGSHTVTQADIDAGEIVNIATATGIPPAGGDPVESKPDTETVPGPTQDPSLALVKKADLAAISAVGQVITYTFTVTNNGNVTIDDIAIDDDKIDAPATCTASSLEPGQSTDCIGTHTVTQADLDAGKVLNTATATGNPPGDGDPVESKPDDETVPAAQQPGLSIEKTADVTEYAKVGDVITYAFTVTNTGNVTLDGIAVNDNQIDEAAQCKTTTLKPGESTTCTGTHKVTQGDIDAGSIKNVATATGTPPTGDPVTSDPDDVTVPGPKQDPSLTIDKTTDATAVSAVGDVITYTFVVQNTGNVTLTGVVINDDKLDAPATCEATTLKPGESTTCSGTHTVTQADLDAGEVKNVATSTGTPPGGGDPITSPPDDVTVPTVANPKLTIEKSADVEQYAAVGDVVTYTFVVENTGNVTLSDIVIDDDQIDAPAVCDVTTLGPGAKATCTGTRTVTQEDIDAGSIKNVATATGTPPTGDPVTSDPDDVTVPGPNPEPGLTVEKTADLTEVQSVGQLVTYTFVVTNTGNVTLSDIVINDDRLDAAATCGVATLKPGESTTCEGVHAVTQADLDAGEVANVATATGTPPGGGDPITSPPDDVTVPVVAKPSLKLEKQAQVPSYAEVGDVVPYKFVVTNTGNVTLSGIAISDDQIDTAATCEATELAPGDFTTCTGSHTVTQADIDAGEIVNIATATGIPPTGGDPVVSEPADDTVPGPAQEPSLAVLKEADLSSVSAVDEVVTYTFTVTNNGNVTIDDIVINDDRIDAPATCEVTSLEPGESTTCTGTHKVTQAELDAGEVVNTATSTGTPPGGGDPITSPPDDETVPVDQKPTLTIEKTADVAEYAKVGEVITYTFVVQNTGNVTVSNIAINDDRIDAPATCGATTLAPGESTTCTGTHTVTQTDLDAGEIENVATATGTPPGGGDPITSPPDDVTVPADQNPALSLEKTADLDQVSAVGEVITYTFTVTNTGNVTLSGIAINDDQIDAAATCAATTLAPGEITECTGSHTVTQADIDAGEIVNIATATGMPPTGDDPVVSEPAEDTVPGPVAGPSLAVLKEADVASYSKVGDVLTYTFTVTNNGNVTIDDIAINDEQLDAPATCTGLSLAPGESMTCTGTHTVTQADLDAGEVLNVATSTGTPPGGGDPITSPPDDVTVPGKPTPGLGLEKTSTTASYTAAGQAIDYVFTVTNTGNVTLSNITIADGLLDAPAVCKATTLKPGESTTCTGSYTATQADVDAGAVTNIATAIGDPPGGGDPVVSPPDSVTVPDERFPSLTVEKSATAAKFAKVGDVIDFTFKVTNTGNVTMSGIVVNDAKIDAAATCPTTTLAPGQAVTCKGSHKVTQADVDAGEFHNVATTTGTPPGGGDPITSPPDEVTIVGPDAKPELSLKKQADRARFAGVGEVVTYTFTVTNTGNVTVNNVAINDPMLDAAAVCKTTSLLPGQSTTCTGTHAVTQADFDAGTVVNVASSTGTAVRCKPTATNVLADAVGNPCPVRSNDATATVAGPNAPAPDPEPLARTGLGVPLVPGLLTAIGLIGLGFLLLRYGRRRA